MCKVTVLTTVYNGEEFLRDTIESVLNQTFTDFEYIIMDNCSTDSTVEIIKSYSDSRIRLIQNETNLGMTGSLNRGLSEARGKYIARIDADDICYPDRLKLQVEYMDKHPNVVLCGGGIDILTDDGIKKKKQKGLSSSQMRFMMPLMNQMIHSCAMFSNAMLKENNLSYDMDYTYAQDYKLWLDLMKYGEAAVLDDVIIQYRMHGNNLSNNNAKFNEEVLSLSLYAIDTMSVAADTKNVIKKYHLIGDNELALDDIDIIAKGLIQHAQECELDITKSENHELLEYIYYYFLQKYLNKGMATYRRVCKSEKIFGCFSKYKLKLYIKCLNQRKVR